MRDNKKTVLIAIIAVVLMILILGVIFVYIFLFTDAMKSNKQLFFKYTIKNAELFQSIETEPLKNFYKKKQVIPYESSGNLSVKYNLGEDIETLGEDIKKLDNVSISYTGKTDVKNKYNYRKVNLNYSEQESMIINYIHSNDYFGVKIDGVLKKYLGIENNNLKNFLDQFGIDTAKIPDKVNIESMQALLKGEKEIFTEEEKEQIKNNYLPMILDSLNDELFTQSETTQGKKITLTIDEEILKNMYIQTITKLKDDEIILRKIKQNYIELGNISEEDADELISILKDSLQESINQNKENNEIEGNDTFNTLAQEKEKINIVISFYIQNKEVVKTELIAVDSKIIINKTENGFNIESQERDIESEEYKTIGNVVINYTNEEDSLNYEIIINTDECIMTYNINYTGIYTLTEVNSNINLNYEYNESTDNKKGLEAQQTNNIYGLSYSIENKTTFRDNINTEFNIKEEGIIVNEYEPKKLESLFEKLTPALVKLNETKMNKTGFKTFPFVYYSPNAVLSMSVLNSAKETIENTDLYKQEVEMFNMKFESYQTNNVSGSRVNDLINVIKSNNLAESEEGHTIQSLIINGVSYDISDKDINTQILENKQYTIKMDKDSEGYIYLIDIEENMF